MTQQYNAIPLPKPKVSKSADLISQIAMAQDPRAAELRDMVYQQILSKPPTPASFLNVIEGAKQGGIPGAVKGVGEFMASPWGKRLMALGFKDNNPMIARYMAGLADQDEKAVADSEFRKQQMGLDLYKHNKALDASNAQKAQQIAFQTSKESKKQEDVKTKEVRAARNVIDTNSRVIKDIDSLLANKNLSKATGLSGFTLGRAPGSEAKSIRGDIKTLTANQAFQSLQAIRDASKTGGALGQVSERELALLESTVANLDPNISDEAFRKNLNKFKTHLQSINKKYRTDFLGENPDDPLGVL